MAATWQTDTLACNEAVSCDNEKATLYPDVAQEGMKQMSEKFKELGNEVYVDAEKVEQAKEGNEAL